MMNGIPKRMRRSLKYFRAPLRVRLCHTNRPESRNIRGMKKTSWKPVNRSKPIQRCMSTTGLNVLIGILRIDKRELGVGQRRVVPNHEDDDKGAQIVELDPPPRRRHEDGGCT